MKENTLTRIKDELSTWAKKNFWWKFGDTLDAFQRDGNIVDFIGKHYNVIEWDMVGDKVKKLCYKGYPTRQPPGWTDIERGYYKA